MAHVALSALLSGETFDNFGTAASTGRLSHRQQRHTVAEFQPWPYKLLSNCARHGKSGQAGAFTGFTVQQRFRLDVVVTDI